MKRLLNTLTPFFNKFFTSTNISKIIVIFTFGILSRYLINEYFNVNVFIEYLSWISITYYSVLATFIVVIHEVFTIFNINIIPTFIIELFSKIGSVLNLLFVKPFIYIYSITWGKTPYISYINDPKKSIMTDSHYYDSKYYSGNRQIPQENNSFYSRIAHGNPYHEREGSSANPNRSIQNTTQSQLYNYLMRECEQNPQRVNSHLSRDYYTPSSYNEQFDDSFHTARQDINPQSYHPYSNEYANNISEPRFFVIDSINNNGINRALKTPGLEAPVAPRPSNLTTPSTMTPLFGSDSSSIPNISTESIAYTNDTNHGTIGPNRSMSDINWEARKYQVARAFEDAAQPPIFKEIDVPLGTNNGKVSLGIKYYYSKKNIHTLYIKYHDIAKRKFFWNIWEKGRDNFETYEEFKANFNPRTNIWKEIAKTTRTDLSNEVRNLLSTDPFHSRRPTIDTRDIRKIPNSSTNSRLNHINTRKNKSIGLSPKRRRV